MLIDANLTLGQRFKHFREQQGFSQGKLAEGICSKSVVSHLENDRQYPSASMFGKLADKLGVPLREIMGMQEKQLEANFQIEMIRVYIEKADYSYALQLIDELKQREDLLDHQRITLLTSRAESLIKNTEYDAALKVLRPFLEQQEIKQTIDDEILCDTYNKLGNAYFRLNDFEKAFSAFEQGYRIGTKMPDFNLVVARVTKNLGLTCNHLGLNEDASRYLQKAYQFFERTSDLYELANTMFYMALATENPDLMIRSRQLYEGLNFVREANMAKQQYAFLVLANEDYAEALKVNESCTTEFLQIGDIPRCIYTLSRSAIICIVKNSLIEAEKYLNRAEEYLGKLESNNHHQLADFYSAKAMYFYQKQNFGQAIDNAKISAEMCVKMGLNVDGADSLKIVAESLHQQGKHEEAYKVSMEAVNLLRHPIRGGSRK